MTERKNSEAVSKPPQFPPPGFPPHNSPRVWLITSSLAPAAVRLIRILLDHGDYIAAANPPKELEDEERAAEFKELMAECRSGRRDREGWKDRVRAVKCDGRLIGNAQAAVAEAVELWGRIDILLCNTSEAVVGTMEELSNSAATRALVRDQFETIYFGQTNIIKATLPLMREKHNGHIMILTGVTGHIGTPGMPMYCASTGALEGFCDCLAYEIAPFNVKLTIVQPNKEIQVLTNKVTFAPQLPQYEFHNIPAPAIRDVLANVMNSHSDTKLEDQKSRHTSGKPAIQSRYPRLPPESRDRLVMETVHAITAIGGHENPPARHIVGNEGVIAVKEKLKTVSEELEDFVEVSCAVDIIKTDMEPPQTGTPRAETMGLF